MDKIWLCEKAYLECFCEVIEEDGFLTYSDELLKDMHSHNFFELKGRVSKEDAINIKEIQGKGHCAAVFVNDYDDKKIDEIAKSTLKSMEITKKGCYLGITKIDTWIERTDCEIFAFTADRIQDVTQKDIEMDGEMIGEDFCMRRAIRKGKVHENNKNIDNYLLYYNKELIATCKLFIKDKVVKIEDFGVLEKYQKMGFGTTLLKYVVSQVLKQNVKTVFLVTDEEETAKEMYLKLGFSKIAEYRELT